MNIINKNITTICLAFTGLFSSTAFCNETLKESPHCLSFGPEVAGAFLHSHFKNTEIDGSKFYWGLGLAYEYVKPSAFYTGARLFSTSTNGDYSAYRQKNRIYSGGNTSFFGHFDFRFGYTFAYHNIQSSPFIEIGDYRINTLSAHGFDDNLAYIAAGLRSRLAVSQQCELGITVKVHGGGQEKAIRFHKESKKHHDAAWGGEVSIPCLIYFSSAHVWHFQAEPYYLRLNFKQSPNICGTHLSLGMGF
jgi:hypothetical protein